MYCRAKGESCVKTEFFSSHYADMFFLVLLADVTLASSNELERQLRFNYRNENGKA